MKQVDVRPPRPPFPRHLQALAAVVAARALAKLPPRRIRTILGLVRRGATDASYQLVLVARNDVVASSVRCAGTHCLQRSLATALLTRMRGAWPTWCVGVRTPPFAAHAWVAAEGRPVGEPADTAEYRSIITVVGDHGARKITANG